jgi:hypothetical protein
MASGKITVTNLTDCEISISIYADGNTNALVASGALTSQQSYDYLVSGYPAYQVDFSPVASGTINAPDVPANGQVVFSINSDSGRVAEE